MTPLPPLKALHVFEAVGRLGGVVAAARELGVSPGAISQQLRRLEESLGMTLTLRQGSGIRLTPAGLAYHAEIAPAFDRLRGAQSTVDKLRGNDTLVISVLPSLAMRWLGPRLFEWPRRHERRLHLVSADAEPDLVRGEADFRITYGRQVHKHALWRELFTDSVVPVCAPALLADRPPIAGPAAVLALPLLGVAWTEEHRPGPSWRQWAASQGLDHSGRDDITFSLNSAAIEAAIDGHGVALAQVAMLDDDLAKGKLVIPWDHRLPLPEPYFLAWNTSGPRPAHAAAFRRWLLQIVPRDQATATFDAPISDPA